VDMKTSNNAALRGKIIPTILVEYSFGAVGFLHEAINILKKYSKTK